MTRTVPTRPRTCSRPALRAGVVAAGVAVATSLLLGACSSDHPPGGPSSGPSSNDAPTQPAGSGAAAHIFSADSWLYADVRTAPVNVDSASMVESLAKQVDSAYGGTAAFNIRQYSANAVTVGAGQKRSDVQFDNCQNKSATPRGLVGSGGQFTDVPIPDDAVPATGNDRSLSVYDRDSGTLWEFWKAKKAADGWHACWGGRIENTATSQAVFGGGFGSTATGIAQIATSVQISDVRSGQIDHAIGIAILRAASWKDISWPAQRSDGAPGSSSPIPEGTRFRLDPSVDVDGLGMSKVGTMIAHAAQVHGFVVTDQAYAVAVIGEGGGNEQAATGKDPWTSLLAGTPGYGVMKGFPWDRLQALPRDFGKPASG